MVVAYLLGQFADLESEQRGRRETGTRMARSAVFQLFYWSLLGVLLWNRSGWSEILGIISVRTRRSQRPDLHTLS